MTPADPSISLIIPARNEEEAIGELLVHLSALGADELIVADGASEDKTTEIACRHAKLVRAEPGRGGQMNAGAAAATGDVVVFLHADVRLNAGAFDRVRSVMRDGGIIGGNFDIIYEGGDLAAGIFTSINRARRRFGIFYGDSGIFCRRAVFEELGGYRSWAVLEDYEFGRRLWKRGKLALLDEPIHVSARRWRNAGVVGTLWSWFWIQALYLAGVSPKKLAGMYGDVR
ncbi:MAG: glycosyltransferase family 2 protein [bacterium]|nr:glycosyltransferase family 2 protein [bacterium]